MWQKVSEWMCSSAGQTFCVVAMILGAVLYVCAIIFEEKWGDGE